MIRRLILVNEVQSLDELATWCGPGIAWVHTNEFDETKVMV